MFQPGDFIEGTLLLIDKPKGWTSFDVIAKLRTATRRFSGDKKLKLGHAGTLDPMATGLLLVATGKFTKKLNELQNIDKEYTGTITIGGITPSYDAESEITQHFDISKITEAQIREAAKKFTGEIMQSPPPYSSVSVDGVRAYQRARNGEQFETKERMITVNEFFIPEIHLPEIKFRISCSKGTYIRSLAHDLGQVLQCGAYLSELRRTKIGAYKIEDALTIDEFLTEIRRSSEE